MNVYAFSSVCMNACIHAYVLCLFACLCLCLCVHVSDCTKAPLRGVPVCDVSLGVQTRAASIVALMNVTEKISRLGNTSPAVSRLGLPAYEWVGTHLLTSPHQAASFNSWP